MALGFVQRPYDLLSVGNLSPVSSPFPFLPRSFLAANLTPCPPLLRRRGGTIIVSLSCCTVEEGNFSLRPPSPYKGRGTGGEVSRKQGTGGEVPRKQGTRGEVPRKQGTRDEVHTMQGFPRKRKKAALSTQRTQHRPIARRRVHLLITP